MSITEDLARDYNLAVGDGVTLNILGRAITPDRQYPKGGLAKFSDQFCLYHVAWPAGQGAHSWLATTRSPDEKTARQIRKKSPPSLISPAVSVSEAVQTVEKVLNLLGQRSKRQPL